MQQQTPAGDRQYNVNYPERWRCNSCRVVFRIKYNEDLPFMLKTIHGVKILCKRCHNFSESLIDDYEILISKKLEGLIYYEQPEPEKDEYSLVLAFGRAGDEIILPNITGQLKQRESAYTVFKKLIKQVL